MISLVDAALIRRSIEQSTSVPSSLRYCECGRKLAKCTRGILCRQCWNARNRARRELAWPKCSGCGRKISKATRGTLCLCCYKAAQPRRAA